MRKLRKILIVSLSVISRDPRVQRQIQCLKANYELHVVGYGEKFDRSCRFYSIPQGNRGFLGKLRKACLLKLGFYELYYWNSTIRELVGELREKGFDIVIANDCTALPLANKICMGMTPLIFDAHEYSPRQFENSLLWRIFVQPYQKDLCRRYIPACSRMWTVGKIIAEEYEANFGVLPTVIQNAPFFYDLNPSPCEDGRIRMIHHGSAHSSRRIELMIELMEHVDERFELDLMLVAFDSKSKAYLNSIQKLAKKSKNVRVIDPVPMEELVRLTNSYDIGLYLLPPINFNQECALPNKFFEFIQARLAIAIGPSPEMARVINKYECGVVAEDFDPKTLGGLLSKLDVQRIDQMKRNSDRAAREECFEKNCEKINSILGELCSEKGFEK